MKQVKGQNRKLLKNRIAEALSDDIKALSPEMQDILLDDLITAFESRFEVLNQAQLNLCCFENIGVKIPQ